jgi:hypothetical protein
MILAGTLVILALWLAFIWFADPDGYRGAWSATRRIAKDENRRAVDLVDGGPVPSRVSEC